MQLETGVPVRQKVKLLRTNQRGRLRNRRASHAEPLAMLSQTLSPQSSARLSFASHVLTVLPTRSDGSSQDAPEPARNAVLPAKAKIGPSHGARPVGGSSVSRFSKT